MAGRPLTNNHRAGVDELRTVDGGSRPLTGAFDQYEVSVVVDLCVRIRGVRYRGKHSRHPDPRFRYRALDHLDHLDSARGEPRKQALITLVLLLCGT